MATPAQEPRTKRFAALAALVWLAASVGAFGLLGELTDHFEATYEGLDLALPRSTAAVIALGPWIRHPACPVIVVIAGLLPFFLGARSMRAARIYLAATAAVILATGIAVSILNAPLRALDAHVAPVRSGGR